MALKIPRNQLGRIKRHAASTYPEECCGALIGETGRRMVMEARPLPNVQESSRERRFLVDPASLAKLEKDLLPSGLSVLGFYHSHPNGVSSPSETDRLHAWPVYSYVILSVKDGRVVGMRSWTLRNDGSAFDEEPVAEA